MSRSTNERKLRERIEAVSELRDAALEYASAHAMSLDLIEPGHRASAENLLHYLALRQRDLRPLQLQLSHLGLSSLGRLEAHVEVTLRAVLFALHRLAGTSGDPPSPEAEDGEFEKGMSLLREQTEEILGPPSPGRSTRIMVTMPGFAAESPDLIPDLLKAGMNLMRINCAHDTCDDWAKTASLFLQEIVLLCCGEISRGSPQLARMRRGPEIRQSAAISIPCSLTANPANRFSSMTDSSPG